jgi:DNA-binding MarR family transcriptional regulator
MVHGDGMSPEATEADTIISDLAALMRRLRRGLARNWCLGSLSMTHLHVLMVLDSEGPQPMGRLADTLLCSLPNATGIVDRMVERGLVERLRDEDDRRLVRVRLSAAGQRTLDEFEMVRHEQFRIILEAMTERERRLCTAAFRVMRDTAERLDSEQAMAVPAPGPTPAAELPHRA